MSEINSAKKLRNLLQRDETILTPGVFDALSAILAEKAGSNAIVLGGYSLSAARLGQPDLGILTMTEMIETIRRITDATSLPLIADGDTGFGGEWNVRRAVKEYERSGAAAMIIEDQTFPKRCGHMSGKSVISKEEHGKKIKIAKDTAKDMLIFARTDALANYGFDEAVSRAQFYLRCGADGIFIEAPKNENELIMVGRQLKGHTLIANMVEGGKTPQMTTEQLKKMGYKIIIYPLTGLYIYAKNVLKGYKELLENGSSENLSTEMFNFNDFNKLLNLEKYIKRS